MNYLKFSDFSKSICNKGKLGKTGRRHFNNITNQTQEQGFTEKETFL